MTYLTNEFYASEASEPLNQPLSLYKALALLSSVLAFNLLTPSIPMLNCCCFEIDSKKKLYTEYECSESGEYIEHGEKRAFSCGTL